MSKKESTHKGAKVLCCILTAAMLMIGTAACGNSGQAKQADTRQGLGGEEQDASGGADAVADSVVEESESLFGKITKVEGSTITLALAEAPSAPEKDAHEGMPGGEAPDGMPGGGEAPDGAPEGMPGGEAPDGAPEGMPSGEIPQGAPGKLPDGEKPDGIGRSMELTLTGETRTIQTSDTTLISINGAEASVSDLAVDDIVIVLMDGDTANSITTGMGTAGMGKQSK